MMCDCLDSQVGPNEAVSLVLMRGSTDPFPSIHFAGNELHFRTAVAPIPVTTVGDACTEGATISPCGNSCAPTYTQYSGDTRYTRHCGGTRCDGQNDGPCWCDPYTTQGRSSSSWQDGCAGKCPSASTTCTLGGGGGTGTVSFVSTFALSYVFILT
jgi:hypothetical protein